MKVDEITDEEIQHELQEGIFAWRGKNQEGMPCCVITGRLLDPVHRRGSHQSFKKVCLAHVMSCSFILFFFAFF